MSDCLFAFSADFVFAISPAYDNIQSVMVKPSIFSTQNSIVSAAAVLSISSGINAVLGFVKSRSLAHFFGVSDELAVFYTADLIPNMVYSFLVVGALSTVFIPVFTQEYKRNHSIAWRTASSFINLSVLVFFLLGTISYITAPHIIRLISVNKFSAEQIALGSSLMRIMLLSQLILIVSSFITCILQSFKYFLIPAMSPILYNLGMILGTILLSNHIGIFGPAIGVLIGSILHLLIQLPFLPKVSPKYSLKLDLKDKGIGTIFNLVPPRILSVFISNLGNTLNSSLAIFISPASVVLLKFANQLQFFPVSLFGLSVASAILPTLSAQADEDDLSTFRKTLTTSFLQMMFLVVPISVILFVLKVPLVRIVYGAASFPWEATVKTSYVLAFFSISILFQSTNYLLTRAFFALKDTKTPVIISSLTLAIHILMAITFVRIFGLGVWSVAFASSIASFIETIYLYRLISAKTGRFYEPAILPSFIKISYASLLMGIMLYIPLKLLDHYVFDTTRTLQLLIATGIASLGGISTYFFLTDRFKVPEIQLLYRLLHKFKFPNKQKVNLLENTA